LLPIPFSPLYYLLYMIDIQAKNKIKLQIIKDQDFRIGVECCWLMEQWNIMDLLAFWIIQWSMLQLLQNVA